MAINDVSGDAETMKATICMNRKVEISVRPPYTFHVRGLEREGKQLGLQLACRRHNMALVVQDRHDAQLRGALGERSDRSGTCGWVLVEEGVCPLPRHQRFPWMIRQLSAWGFAGTGSLPNRECGRRVVSQHSGREDQVVGDIGKADRRTVMH